MSETGCACDHELHCIDELFRDEIRPDDSDN